VLTEIERPDQDAPPSDRQPLSTTPWVADRVTIWGLPIARFTYAQALDAVDRLIERGEPAYFITANLNYAMLSARESRLREVNEKAAFILADGMPLVWYTRLAGRPLPGRVTGADLAPMLFERAAARGHSVYLLGGAEGVADEVARVFRRKYPRLRIVGVEAPVLGELSAERHERLIERIRAARPDLLLVALGQPNGEVWLSENCRALGVPACVQLGASFDFLAGRVRRAPRWMQRIGAEWLYRTLCKPGRMIPRYLQNGLFLLRAVGADLLSALRTRR